MNTYDLVIVGAGPAGATLARLLGERMRVLVLDGRIGAHVSKPCGGLLAPDAQKALASFDLTLPKDVLVDPQIFSVKTIDLASGAVRHYPRAYLNLDRDRFDQWLVSLIPDCAEVAVGRAREIVRQEDGFEVSWADTDGALHRACARCVVGADGANSIVRRTFFPGKTPRSYVAIQQWFPIRERNPFYSCIFDPETTDCCAWSICKDDHFIYGGAFPAENSRARFERQKEKLEAFGFEFGEPVKTEACRVLRPDSPNCFVTGENGVFLIGEAAGFISASSLEGVSWAIRSAVALRDAFASGKDPNVAYRRGTRKMRLQLFGKVLKCPFMYAPTLRRAVMASGLQTVHIED